MKFSAEKVFKKKTQKRQRVLNKRAGVEEERLGPGAERRGLRARRRTEREGDPPEVKSDGVWDVHDASRLGSLYPKYGHPLLTRT